MFSPYRCAGRLLTAAIFIFVLVLFCAGEVSAQTEKELTEKAVIKMKLKKYTEAAAILKTAREKYPSSIEVARLTVELYEETEADTQALIDAYGNLIKALQVKEVVEGSFTSKERALLKKTEKKLDKLAKFRREVDAALKEFCREGVAACRKLASLGKHTGASFVFQRLNALAKDEELNKEVKTLAGELKEKRALLKIPKVTSGPEDDTAEKLIRKAQRSLKSGKYEKARLECKAALEADPNLALARAILCDVADKTNDATQMLTQGLSYLLFPPQSQDIKYTEEIEKRILKVSPELRAFFDNTAKAADIICKAAGTAMRKKKSSDLAHALGQLACLTHRTKKIDSLILKHEAMVRGKKIFDGKSLAGWQMVGSKQGKAAGGCMVLKDNWTGRPTRIAYTKTQTSGSFSLEFTIQVEYVDKPLGPDHTSVISVSFWGGRDATSPYARSTILRLHNCENKKMVDFTRWSPERSDWDLLSSSGYSGPIFEPGKWYKIRVEYVQGKRGAGRIIVTVNGEKATTLPVPASASPKRTGYTGAGVQLYKSVKFKDIYLVP